MKKIIQGDLEVTGKVLSKTNFNEIDANDIDLSSYNKTTDNLSLCIFVRNGGSAFIEGRLYEFKIYENTTLVRNFVPCYRKADNVIGLYDLANGVFYTNAGTGTFLKGGDV